MGTTSFCEDKLERILRDGKFYRVVLDGRYIGKSILLEESSPEKLRKLFTLIHERKLRPTRKNLFQQILWN